VREIAASPLSLLALTVSATSGTPFDSQGAQPTANVWINTTLPRSFPTSQGCGLSFWNHLHGPIAGAADPIGGPASFAVIGQVRRKNKKGRMIHPR